MNFNSVSGTSSAKIHSDKGSVTSDQTDLTISLGNGTIAKAKVSGKDEVVTNFMEKKEQKPASQLSPWGTGQSSAALNYDSMGSGQSAAAFNYGTKKIDSKKFPDVSAQSGNVNKLSSQETHVSTKQVSVSIGGTDITNKTDKKIIETSLQWTKFCGIQKELTPTQIGGLIQALSKRGDCEDIYDELVEKQEKIEQESSDENSEDEIQFDKGVSNFDITEILSLKRHCYNAKRPLMISTGKVSLKPMAIIRRSVCMRQMRKMYPP